ncbi:hypothetical protein E4U56_005218 [Claviceps arundinis]|uniref:BHLH domain-containing protein n=1 Tax=Claviceps arundinis TaxID=1623583 RepID=A0A9P7SQK8_9HYPO|nr:hypothetical protein E4U56_005218 [Claviceps arundinis]
MELNYECLPEPAPWNLDYTMFLASDPGQLPNYEPMEAVPPPESFGMWPSGSLPAWNTDLFGMPMTGMVSGSKAPCPRLQTAPRKLPYSHAYGWPQIPLDDTAAAAAEYSYPQDLMQSPASQQSFCTRSTDDMSMASPLTPSSDDASALEASASESAWARSDLHFQAFDSFKDDSTRYSTAVADHEMTPPEWCWSVDTTAAASLMNTTHTPLPISGPCPPPLNVVAPLNTFDSFQTITTMPPYQNPASSILLQQSPLPPLPAPSSSYDKPYPVSQALFQMDTTISTNDTPSTESDTAGGMNINMNMNMNMAFVRPRRGKQSVEQRRRNHIQQEQRRRAVLKNGFSDLTDLVPGLGARDMSKSAVLEKTAEWLERLVSGNKLLRERLAVTTEGSQQGHL